MIFFGKPLRLVLAVTAFLATAALFPAWWSARDAPAWYAGDLEKQRGLARNVAAQIRRGIAERDFQTGSAQYAGEWLFGTYLMAGIGFCQLVSQHPEAAQEFGPQIELCILELASERVRAFDTDSWGNDAIETLDRGRGHAAYLGYFNLLLGLYRELAPENRFVPLNDRITAALEQRMTISPNGLIETYPGEWYPVDNSPVLASIALHARATHQGEPTALVQNFHRRGIDPSTGLLYQALAQSGAPSDAPRGSGSALAVFFLGHGLQPLAREIFDAVRRELSASVLGFGVIREYPRGQGGRGDIDSGPVVFGFGFSATGFSIGGAKMFRDRALFERLWASAQMAGAPVRTANGPEFVTAGPLGNAILLAMATSRPESVP